MLPGSSPSCCHQERGILHEPIAQIGALQRLAQDLLVHVRDGTAVLACSISSPDCCTVCEWLTHGMVVQIPVRRPQHLETTCLGAAYAAGIGSGFWSKDWVLHSDGCHAQDSQEFHPKVPTPLLSIAHAAIKDSLALLTAATILREPSWERERGTRI